ncbi:MAG: HDOD domain-containing protein [Planctomycetaceae bacterium]
MIQNQTDFVQAAGEVAPLPPSVVRLLSLFADPDYEMRDVVRAVELDSSLCFKLMRLANSAAHSGTIRTTGEAVVRLGSETVQSLSMAEVARPDQNIDLTPFGLTPDSYWRHCIAVVSFADALYSERRSRIGSGLSVTAILHDFGKLVLAGNLQPEDAQRLKLRDQAQSPVAAENEIFGINHAELTGLVAESWALPSDLAAAMRSHHDPDAAASPICHALNLANQLAWQLDERMSDLQRESDSREASLAALNYADTDWERLFRAGEIRYHATLEFYG